MKFDIEFADTFGWLMLATGFGLVPSDTLAVVMHYTDGPHKIVVSPETEDHHLEAVILHEIGHIVGRTLYSDNSEEFADDFAFDFCEELGYDTSVFNEYPVD